ncbi:LysR family transcriptional regulator [Mycolicibacterium phlei]|jgi:DNA-binding transcriptional LysR family regulator|uniref:Probable hydrogen peroxide-inducible genes activator n=1 Tax=Mycolicibacterium phlei DSM 43239 = CCUG 21000 TaxID=1226750 RepID=A0A5N5UYK4_MYCPH|nr:LysR family transcriptional regulator [Mycolicibacterium phlei]VEG11968.1 LysR family transcriptional regulator [Mycobacteroides chelonae]AMO63879.1 HTH-type transcriptional regulator BenM [Mycolicibacterium phlei]EID09218.1 transcriptional regulator [Mycolicibacterium phlei RIVM601174]KAB7754733.1 LysR family transcriptional regulator [Mycolicibacterium phlei DSM 43239 = CCUG 21000]KXW65378.1 LysR family transcriptional regulator [Mycolicibacterium phlei DSM 43239 = CCUG 21000]
MDIDFTRLRYFVAVADELHFKRAADKLMITPPPLSKQIKLLEKELGGPLFERGYHEVRLTALGERLLGPAREILRQVEDFKSLAAQEVAGLAPLRVSATAYAPSDLLAQLESVLAGLPEPTEFNVPGSAAEVTAKLIAGHAELGLIHLPASDKRLRYKVVAAYQGAIAVRYDDPLAERDLVAIEDLRDREVAIDIARPNPVVMASMTRQLNNRGVNNIVRTTNQRGGEVEMATQVFNRHLVAVISYAPESFIGKMFSPPEFKMIPIDETTWPPAQIALAWVPERLRSRLSEIEFAVDQIADKLGPVHRGA